MKGRKMDNNIYRKKSIERISSPEQLDDFIKVTRPSVWLVVAALVILIAGAVVWAAFAAIEVTEKDGETRSVHPIEFVVN
ncbi:MAG: hypothetical protein IJ736_00070, partial [Firmicutes bacterium]|nr:hypothetical protein [Bacillota bacterium]